MEQQPQSPYPVTHPLYLQEFVYHLRRAQNEQHEQNMRGLYVDYYSEYMNLRSRSSRATVIFRGDVPCDATDREIEQPFRAYRGFVDVHYHRDVAGETEIFVKFDSVDHALAARERLHGYVWDRKKPSRTITENKIRAVRIVQDVV